MEGRIQPGVFRDTPPRRMSGWWNGRMMRRKGAEVTDFSTRMSALPTGWCRPGWGPGGWSWAKPILIGDASPRRVTRGLSWWQGMPESVRLLPRVVNWAASWRTSRRCQGWPKGKASGSFIQFRIHVIVNMRDWLTRGSIWEPAPRGNAAGRTWAKGWLSVRWLKRKVQVVPWRPFQIFILRAVGVQFILAGFYSMMTVWRDGCNLNTRTFERLRPTKWTVLRIGYFTCSFVAFVTLQFSRRRQRGRVCLKSMTRDTNRMVYGWRVVDAENAQRCAVIRFEIWKKIRKTEGD